MRIKKFYPFYIWLVWIAIVQKKKKNGLQTVYKRQEFNYKLSFFLKILDIVIPYKNKKYAWMEINKTFYFFFVEKCFEFIFHLEWSFILERSFFFLPYFIYTIFI